MRGVLKTDIKSGCQIKDEIGNYHTDFIKVDVVVGVAEQLKKDIRNLKLEDEEHMKHDDCECFLIKAQGLVDVAFLGWQKEKGRGAR